MKGTSRMYAFVLVVVFAVSGAAAASAQTHHVVGGDGGWSSEVADRVFRVGDKILFSLPATKESIVELQTLEEFESCDLTNPIKMYTDDNPATAPVVLEKAGVRYFASGSPESCMNGHKLPVAVQQWPEFQPPQPFQPPPTFEPPPFVFPPPATPSASNSLNGLSSVLFAGLVAFIATST